MQTNKLAALRGAIDQALQNSYCLTVFRQRYGGEWVALIAPDISDADWIDSHLSGADLGAIEMQTYLGQAGDLFPVAPGRTPTEAISALEARLEQVPHTHTWMEWQIKLTEAFAALRDAQRAYPGGDGFIGRALEAGELLRIDSSARNPFP